MAFLSNLVVPYQFEKSKTLLNRTIYHIIYQYDNLVLFKGKKIIQEIKYWLVDFHQTVDKVAGNQHLQFTAEIWMNDENLPPSLKKDRFQITTNKKLTFLDMKMS